MVLAKEQGLHRKDLFISSQREKTNWNKRKKVKLLVKPETEVRMEKSKPSNLLKTHLESLKLQAAEAVICRGQHFFK